jgi:hypothetical protein
MGPSRKRFALGLLIWGCCLSAWPVLIRKSGLIPPPLSSTMTVAAVGINQPSSMIYEEGISQASRAGARLVVLSETCVGVKTSDSRERALTAFSTLAAKYRDRVGSRSL